jgi:hypothetical protein
MTQATCWTGIEIHLTSWQSNCPDPQMTFEIVQASYRYHDSKSQPSLVICRSVQPVAAVSEQYLALEATLLPLTLVSIESRLCMALRTQSAWSPVGIKSLFDRASRTYYKLHRQLCKTYCRPHTCAYCAHPFLSDKAILDRMRRGLNASE